MKNPGHILTLGVCLTLPLSSCSRSEPIRNPGRYHDAILFERATTALQEKRFTVANVALQTLVATYPGSEYAGRAKRMLADPRIARCGGGFSTTPASLCDPGVPSREGQ